MSEAAEVQTERWPSEKQVDEAKRILRADYYQSIHSYAADFKGEIDAGDYESREDFFERLAETVDSCYWVVYYHAQAQCLFASENWDAYGDEGLGDGSELLEDGNVKFSLLAYCAVKRDIMEHLDALGVDVNKDETFAATVECAYCFQDIPKSEAQEVPAVDDEEAWVRLATSHTEAEDKFGLCEWIRTRAHRVFDGDKDKSKDWAGDRCDQEEAQ